MCICNSDAPNVDKLTAIEEGCEPSSRRYIEQTNRDGSCVSITSVVCPTCESWISYTQRHDPDPAGGSRSYFSDRFWS